MFILFFKINILYQALNDYKSFLIKQIMKKMNNIIYCIQIYINFLKKK